MPHMVVLDDRERKNGRRKKDEQQPQQGER